MNNIDTTTSFQDHKDVLVKIQNFQEKYHPEAYEEHMTGNDLNQNKHSFKEHDGENNLQVSNNASNHQHRFATPYEVQGDDGIYISRLRRDDDHHLSFWGTWDNTLRGAASDLFDVFFMLINRKY
jgi:aspartate-semialdehyde dehydrogenase